MSTAQTLEQIKMQLRSAKDQGGSVSADLYSHLTEVFNRIISYHPHDALDKFEEISNLVKETNLKVSNPKFDFEINQGGAVMTNKDALVFIEKAKNLLREVPDVVRPSERSLLTKNVPLTIPNLME